jgi:hypothetical protein
VDSEYGLASDDAKGLRLTITTTSPTQSIYAPIGGTMSAIERSRDHEQLWRVMMPDVAAPETRQFVVWANRFTDAQLERAIMRTHRKFAPGTREIDPTVIYRYVTGLLLNLEREGSSATATHHQPVRPIRNATECDVEPGGEMLNRSTT